MDNTNQLSNIVNMVNLLSSVSSPKSPSGKESKARSMFPLDEQIHTEPVRICKCLIPYLPYERQKTLSVGIKLFELFSVMEFYSNPDVVDNSIANFRESKTWQTDLLYSIKDNLEPNNAYWIDIFFKINDVQKILAAARSNPNTIPAPFGNYDTDKSSEKHESSSEVIKRLSPQLNENQKNILEVLSTIMK